MKTNETTAFKTAGSAIVAGLVAMLIALPGQNEMASEVLPDTIIRQAGAFHSMRPPVDNVELSARFHDAGGNWSSGFHTGLDFVVPTGTPVFAAISGTVVQAGGNGPYGNSITIKGSDGTVVMTAHMSKLAAKKGQTVPIGQEVGKSGATGNVTGPHVHFEVLKGKKQFDPEPYLWGHRLTNIATLS
jgi:murein DD-endopeptidase MepM/ murein hydrolase activator NlpD